MYTIICDCDLNEEIILEKYGIRFRKLSEKEKNGILESVEIINKYKDETKKMVGKYQYKETEFEQLLELSKQKEKNKSDIAYFSYLMMKSGFKYNNKRQINKIIEHILVIEVDKAKIIKYLDESYIPYFISNVLNLNCIYNNPISQNSFKKNVDYTYVLDNQDIFDKQKKDYFYTMMLNIVFYYDGINYENKVQLKHVDLSLDYLNDLVKLISSFNENDLIRFVEILDLLFMDVKVIQNKIINNVLISESLLIKENSNIRKEYVLKGGMILKKYIDSNSTKSNEAVSLLLGFVYDIRSDIVHGNIKKIEEDLNKLNQKNIKIKELNGDNKLFKDKKKQAFSIAYTISKFAVNSIIRYWIENYIEVEYLKNN